MVQPRKIAAKRREREYQWERGERGEKVMGMPRGGDHVVIS
jgi:hypothetical protein